jgi:putative transposase
VAKKDDGIVRIGYKYRAYPTPEQKVLIDQQFGACRYVYNFALRLKQKAYKYARVSLDITKDIRPLLTHMKKEDKWEWLADAESQSLYEAYRNLENAYDRFFDPELKAGFPQFKTKKNPKQSFQITNGAVIPNFDAGYVRIPKIGNIPIRVHKDFVGTPKTVTVSRKPSGKYYISILNETGKLYPETQSYEPHSTLGIDLGLKNFAALSTGELIPNSHFKKDSEPRIKCLQRRLSHKKIGSANFKKAKLKLARLEEHISNQRSYFHHNLSARLVSENQAIIVENLNVAGMLKNPKLAKSIADVGWSTFINQLEYKSKLQGKYFNKVGRFFPSSKLCSECGYKLPSLSLDIREWTCPVCNTTHDRDFNASINIRNTAVQVG